jgi:hypothetical protein
MPSAENKSAWPRRQTLAACVVAVALSCIVPGAVWAQSTKAQPKAKREPSGQTRTFMRNLSGFWVQKRPPATADQSWVYTFAGGEPAMTPWAMERYSAAKPSFGPHAVSIGETNDPVYHGCFPPGVPRVYLHPFPMQIVQVPGEVIILYEYDNLSRHIYTDGRSHQDGLSPTWMGDSVGKWEGSTLVADTTNFNDKTWVDRIGHPHTDALRVVERFRRVNHDNLEIEITVEDAKAYTRPWKTELRYGLQSGSLLEQFCEDNNTFGDIEKQETTSPGK